jgi:hypothetical protein
VCGTRGYHTDGSHDFNCPFYRQNQVAEQTPFRQKPWPYFMSHLTFPSFPVYETYANIEQYYQQHDE